MARPRSTPFALGMFALVETYEHGEWFSHELYDSDSYFKIIRRITSMCVPFRVRFGK